MQLQTHKHNGQLGIRMKIRTGGAHESEGSPPKLAADASLLTTVALSWPATDMAYPKYPVAPLWNVLSRKTPSKLRSTVRLSDLSAKEESQRQVEC